MEDFSNGRAKRLDDIDLPMMGRKIGVGEDEIHAIIDVESRGTGFDRYNRPIILFERHIFHRHLKGEERKRAVAQGLAVRRWSRATYNQDQYALLVRAMKINPTAALMSCSWGLFQIMGFNYKLAGYTSVNEMVAFFQDDEEQHLKAAISFIKNAGLDDELRRHDWAGFAKGYNGSGYAANKYDTKLAAAFAKWSRIKDTPIPPAVPDSVEKVLKDTAAENRISKSPIAAILTFITSITASFKQIGPELGIMSVQDIPDWMVYGALGLSFAAAGFLIYERTRHGRNASEALDVLQSMRASRG